MLALGAGYFINRLHWPSSQADYEAIAVSANAFLAELELDAVPATHSEMEARHDEINDTIMAELTRRRSLIAGDALALPLYSLGWCAWQVAIMAPFPADNADDLAGLATFMKLCIEDVGVDEKLVDELIEKATAIPVDDDHVRIGDVHDVVTQWLVKVLDAWQNFIERVDPAGGHAAMLDKLGAMQALLEQAVARENIVVNVTNSTVGAFSAGQGSSAMGHVALRGTAAD